MEAWEEAFQVYRKHLDEITKETGKPVKLEMWEVFKAGWDMRVNYLPLLRGNIREVNNGFIGK